MKSQIGLMLCGLTVGMWPLSGADKTWRGSAVIFGDPDAGIRWSVPDNWEPSGVPQNGDKLKFFVRAAPGQGAGVIALNDVTNLTVSSLSFGANADLQTAEFLLLGNQVLGIRESIQVSDTTEANVTIRFALRLEGDAKFDASNGFDLNPYVGLHLNGPIDLNGHTLHLAEDSENGGDLDLAATISGHGNLVIEQGSVELTGDEPNMFTGVVTVAPMTTPFGSVIAGSNLILNKGNGPAVPGDLNIGAHCEVKLERAHQIADSGAVTLFPAGAFKLQGNTETISSLYFIGRSTNGSPIRVETGDATLSVEKNITADNTNDNMQAVSVIEGQLGLPPGNHTIQTLGNQRFALKIEARIIGDGGFTKTGASGLLLSGHSTFNGDAVVQAGRLEVTRTNALGSANGATILAGGELSLRDAVVEGETLFANSSTTRVPELGVLLESSGTSSWTGPILLTTNLTVSGGTTTLAGPVTGQGGLRFIFNNRVQLTGVEPNIYFGLTLFDGTLLELNKPSGVPAISGQLIVGSGNDAPHEVRWLQNYQKTGLDVTLFRTALLNLNDHADDFGPITFNGGTISTGVGELGLYGLVTVNPSSSEATFDGRLGMPPGIHEFRVGDGSPLIDLGVNAVLVGLGHLRKTGPGQMWLNGSNSYTGVTFVEQGALVAFHDSALGAATGGTTVNDGASLILNAPGSTIAEPISLRGSGDGSHGALDIFGRVTLRNPFPSIFACLDLTTNATIRVERDGALTADGIISGTGPLTKLGPGSLVFAGGNTNSYSGETVVREGLLELRKPNFVVAIPGELTIGPAPFNSLAAVRFFQNGGITDGDTVTVNAGSLLDLNGFSQLLSRLNLNDGGDAQTGPGLLSFTVGGMVAVGSLSSRGSHASSYLSGNVGLPANGTLTFAVNAYAPTAPFDFSPELEMFAQVAAPAENPNFERAGIAKTGSGTLKLTADNSFHGRVDVTGGTLLAAGNNTLGSESDGTFVMNDATLALQGDVTITGEILVLNSTAPAGVQNLAGANTWAGLVIMNQSSTVSVADATSLDLAGALSGTRDLTKVGTGTLILSGSEPNSYDGETFINEGALLLNKSFVVTAIPGPLSIGTPDGVPALAQNLNGYQIVGNIFINRHGLYDVNGQEENVDHLWLYDGGAVQTGPAPGALYLKTGGSIHAFPGTDGELSTIRGNLGLDPGQHDIVVAASDQGGMPGLLVDALVSQPLDSAGIRKLGAGALRLTANNSYTGPTILETGVLQVDGTQGGSGVSIFGGAQLMGNGRLGALEFVNSAFAPGVVAPGHSPGILSCGSFNLSGVGGTLRIELNGTSVGGTNGYDQLYVRGGLSPATLDGMTLDASLSFVSSVNDQFTIVRKDGVRVVTGQFVGLPEGASFYIDGEQFAISYTGGDGNDVVLTRLVTPPKPQLSIESLAPSSVRLFWPSSFTDYTLQFSTNLDGSGWKPVLPFPTVVGTNQVVTNATAGGGAYYRLIRD